MAFMSDSDRLKPISTPFTRLFGCEFPIIAGPMFLVSDENLVSAVSEAGALGGMPSLNWRTTEQFRQAVRNVKSKTRKPFAVNLIVNQANTRQHPDLDVCAEEKVPLVITSLGSPKETIRRMHEVGCKVFCDVTTLDYAKKVQDLGADGVIAVSSGAGGHAGPISPLVLIPYLKRHLKIPVVAAGGIATGEQVAAALVLGASAVQIGTRFIASREAKVDAAYKNAIVNSDPEDIVMTLRISGTPAAVIKTPYIEKVGLDLNPIEKTPLQNSADQEVHEDAPLLPRLKGPRKSRGTNDLERSLERGSGRGPHRRNPSGGKIVQNLVREYHEAAERLPQS